jgi:hypothetical protein
MDRRDSNRSANHDQAQEYQQRHGSTPLGSSAGHFDEDDGQMGPDELPDPQEVVMNHEAKQHLS